MAEPQGDAEDRTEAASARRLSRARESGDVPLSKELPAAAVLAAAAMALILAGPDIARGLATGLVPLLAAAHATDPIAGIGIAATVAARAAAPFILAALVAGAAAVLLQTGFLLNGAALLPDLARLDPRRGLSRVFGTAALGEAGKAVMKLAVVAGALWFAISAALHHLPATLLWTPDHLLAETAGDLRAVMLAVVMAQGVLAGLDVIRARLSYARKMRMSRQELKDEHKETEGDPVIKARIRQIRMARARRRMMQAVPTATVVVTNPTHYAVALRYERGAGAAAPRIVAKGMDTLAARIRDIARQHRVPLMADPPLARALYRVELDAEIPADLYQAVAELIAQVWRLDAAAGRAAARA